MARNKSWVQSTPTIARYVSSGTNPIHTLPYRPFTLYLPVHRWWWEGKQGLVTRGAPDSVPFVRQMPEVQHRNSLPAHWPSQQSILAFTHLSLNHCANSLLNKTTALTAVKLSYVFTFYSTAVHAPVPFRENTYPTGIGLSPSDRSLLYIFF